MNKISYMALLILLMKSIMAFSQDTVFLNKHNLGSSVKNIQIWNNEIYAKTNSSIFHLNNSEWEEVPVRFKKPFGFYEEGGFVEYDYLPNKYMFEVQKMSELIPQKSLFNPTKALKGNRLFVAVSGSLYEYQINPYFIKKFPNYSFRDIYKTDSVMIYATYSGIIINDSIYLSKPSYSSGAISKTTKGIYLSSDQLFKIFLPDSSVLIQIGQNNLNGYFRKIVEWNGLLFSQNTKSINLFSEKNGLSPIHQGYEYLDLEPFSDGIIFSTNEGKVFTYDGEQVLEIADLKTTVTEIYIDNQDFLFGTDKGVFQLNIKKYKIPPTQISKVPFVAQIIKDSFGNLWISSDEGLFILPKSSQSTISFIKEVEFNREAMAYFYDTLYVGSIEGLYVIDAIAVQKSFLPFYISKNKLHGLYFFKWWIVLAICLVGVLVFFGFYFKRRKNNLEKNEHFSGSAFDLDIIKLAILENQIVSVDGLAKYLETNPVQLNRNFKAFDTTPGRFLKKVKLDYAEEMVKKGLDLDSISKVTGYSVIFLKKQLEDD